MRRLVLRVAIAGIMNKIQVKVDPYLNQGLFYSPLSQPNVMLRSYAVNTKVFTPWIPATSNDHLMRALSTNTAINQSLRKSRSQVEKASSRYQPRANPSKHFPHADTGLKSAFRIHPRAGNAQRTLPTATYDSGGSSEDRIRGDALPGRTRDRRSRFLASTVPLGGYSRYESRYDASPLSTFTKHGRKLTRSKPTAAGSQYDYSEKPGGNRAARRELLFGRKPNPLRPQDSKNVHQSRSGFHQNAERQSLPRDDDNENLVMQKALKQDQVALGRSQQRSRKLPSEDLEKRNYRHDEAPIAIPYTTSASEFLYGTSVVKAALEAKRRRCYKLYMYDGDDRQVRDQDTTIRRIASDKDVVTQRVKGDWLHVMDKMSQGRPHNVC